MERNIKLTQKHFLIFISQQVGLYAKWGSGKSFLLKKLREEMKNYVRDWVDPESVHRQTKMQLFWTAIFWEDYGFSLEKKWIKDSQTQIIGR